MARKPVKAVKAAAPKPTAADAPKLTGTDRDFDLRKLKPNTWNPNHMSAFMLKSFEQELRETGWLRSMKLLVWGTDDKGVEQNIIIDGEHRWKVGKRLGYKVVPVVFMDGITEAEAKRMTIRIRKQGEYDPDDLGKLLQEPEVRGDLALADYGLMLGIADAELGFLLGNPESRSTSPLAHSEDQPTGTQPTPITRGPKVTLEFSSSSKRDAFKTYLAKLAVGEAAKLPGGDLLCDKLRIK